MKEAGVKVSIIVPVYKAELYVQECIDSIVRQTFSGWECILVDDGSPDGSGKICDAAAEKDSRFRVIHKPNAGVSAARNTALDAAQGEYIVFCDADDMMSPVTLEAALTQAKEHAGDFICWQLCRKKDELVQPGTGLTQKIAQKTFSSKAGQVYRTTVPGHSNCNKLFVRTLIEKNGLRYDPAVSMAEDYEFGGRYLEAFFAEKPEGLIRQLELPLYFWRENLQSATHQKVKADKTAKVQYDPALYPDYARHMMEEYDSARAALGGWQVLSEEELLPQLRTYLRRFAFAVWVAHQRKEPLPQNFFACSQLQEIMALLREHRGYSPYYVPFKLKSKGLLRRLYQSDETRVMKLYRLMYTFGYYALFLVTGKRWKQP